MHKAAIVFVRRQDGWLSEIVSGDDARLDLPEIGIAVPLHEVYAKTGLRESTTRGNDGVKFWPAPDLLLAAESKTQRSSMPGETHRRDQEQSEIIG